MRQRAAEAVARPGGGQHHVVGARGDRHDERVGDEGHWIQHGKHSGNSRQAEHRRHALRPTGTRAPRARTLYRRAHRYGVAIIMGGMIDAFICDAVRTPIGRYGGVLAGVRADDLAAITITALLRRNPTLDPAAVEELLLGCANQAGEDNRNVARMALLLAGLPVSVSGATINRLCGSGLDALASAARLIRCGEAQVVIAGGVESMSRAPFVMPKADAAFARNATIYDTTLGWRFVNPRMEKMYGVESMPETGENVAAQFRINRADQDLFALRSQERTAAAYARSFFASEMTAVEIPQRKGPALSVDRDEHP